MPVIVSAAVIIQDNKVLLTQRPGNTHLAGSWEFPGGKLEAGESPEEALTRELLEETSLQCEVGEILDVTFWRYATKDVLLLFYRARILSGEVRHLGIANHVWATLETLDRYELPPADVRVMQRIRAILSASTA